MLEFLLSKQLTNNFRIPLSKEGSKQCSIPGTLMTWWNRRISESRFLLCSSRHITAQPMPDQLRKETRKKLVKDSFFFCVLGRKGNSQVHLTNSALSCMIRDALRTVADASKKYLSSIWFFPASKLQQAGDFITQFDF